MVLTNELPPPPPPPPPPYITNTHHCYYATNVHDTKKIKIKINNCLALELSNFKGCHGNILVMLIASIPRLKPCWVVTGFIPAWGQRCLNTVRERETMKDPWGQHDGPTHLQCHIARSLRFLVVFICQRCLPTKSIHTWKSHTYSGLTLKHRSPKRSTHTNPILLRHDRHTPTNLNISTYHHLWARCINII